MTSYFVSADHLGGTRDIVDSSGALIARHDYDPYGRSTQVTGTLDSGYGFGRYRPEGSYLLAPFRAYSPDIGRWLSEDPAGFVDGPNKFQFVRNAPTSVVDPTGLSSECRDAALAHFKKCVVVSFIMIDAPMIMTIASCLSSGPGTPICLPVTVIFWEIVDITLITICAYGAKQVYDSCVAKCKANTQ
jgi:RHS repeat-associated protein